MAERKGSSSFKESVGDRIAQKKPNLISKHGPSYFFSLKETAAK